MQGQDTEVPDCDLTVILVIHVKITWPKTYIHQKQPKAAGLQNFPHIKLIGLKNRFHFLMTIFETMKSEWGKSKGKK